MIISRFHIKRQLPLVLAGALLAGGIFLIYLHGGILPFKHPSTMAPTGAPAILRQPVPARLIEAGPYGTDVRSYFTVDNLTINLKAGRLYMKKSNTLGFSNALFKKLAARDLELVVKRAGVVVLSLTKAYQEMPLDMDRFIIDHPRIRHPQDMRPPHRLMIEKSSQRVTFWYGTEKRVWNLETGGNDTGLF